LIDNAKWKGRLAGVASADADLKVATGGHLGQLHHGRLAQAGLTDDEQAAAVAFPCLGQKLPDRS
jgi:hypothetical protein